MEARKMKTRIKTYCPTRGSILTHFSLVTGATTLDQGAPITSSRDAQAVDGAIKDRRVQHVAHVGHSVIQLQTPKHLMLTRGQEDASSQEQEETKDEEETKTNRRPTLFLLTPLQKV